MNISSSGNDTMMPAKNDSFIESMKVSVGLRADISRGCPRRPLSGWAGFQQGLDLVFQIAGLVKRGEKSSRLSSGRASAARSSADRFRVKDQVLIVEDR